MIEGYPAIIMELKYGKSAEEAITQILKRNYVDEVRNENEILLVGIKYSIGTQANTKKHTCIMKQYK